MLRIISILSCVIFFLSSCNDEVARSYEAKPTALGRMNEIVVLSDDVLWEGAVGDTFNFYFASAYPIMPTPEPLFDLRQFSVNDLTIEPLRKELRTYVLLADISDTDSPATKMVRNDLGEEKFREAVELGLHSGSVGRDKWARNQIVIYLFGRNEAELNKTIKDHFSAIVKRVNKHDENQLAASIYSRQEDLGLGKEIEENFGIQMRVPADFQKAIHDEENSFIWLKKDVKEGTLSVVLRKLAYTSKDQLSVENIKQIRDDYGKFYMTTNTEGSYMRLNDKDLPIYDYVYEIDGNYTREIRGVWEMTRDYMGGPFVSFLILNETKGELIFVDTFVYAAGKNKRNWVQQLEYIVKSSKIM